MNYAKVIGAALQLFPKRIKLILIDADTGEYLGSYKMGIGQLPQRLDRPVSVEAGGKCWQVLKASHGKAEDYRESKELILYVQEAAKFQLPEHRFWVPTFSTPLLFKTDGELWPGFTLDIKSYSWRQIEFLPISLLPVIQEEIKDIESILSTAASNNPLMGYPEAHTRNKVGLSRLNIPFPEFCDLTRIIEKGRVRFSPGLTGFPQNCFVVRSTDNTYYGLTEDNMITTLCIPAFDSIDEELYTVAVTFGLVLVDWCNALIITVADNASAESMEDSSGESVAVDF